MAGTIVFNSIVVNTNGIVFVGENAAPGWDSHNKKQMSIGMISNAFGAGGIFTGNLNLLNDNDLLDTLIKDPDVEVGPGVQV